MKKGLFFLLFGLWLPGWAQQLPRRTENVILVTLDGVRWQEIFGVRPPEKTVRFRGATSAQQRRALLPFLWDTVATQGQLYGNRTCGNDVEVANYQRFSYPGYQEILSGAADVHVHNNRPVESSHATVLDFLSEQPGYQGRVAAFASWATLGPILRDSTGNFSINAGWQPSAGNCLTAREHQLNTLLGSCARPWQQVRADTLTFGYALEYLKREQPRVLYLSLGETDEFAHEHDYARYLQAAHQADSCLRSLWHYVQTTPQYRNKTTLLITTDHGRGRGKLWAKHNGFVPGSRQTWLAVLGPDTPPTGEQRTAGHFSQNQVAQTLASLLGLVYSGPPHAGAAIGAIAPVRQPTEQAPQNTGSQVAGREPPASEEDLKTSKRDAAGHSFLSKWW